MREKVLSEQENDGERRESMREREKKERVSDFAKGFIRTRHPNGLASLCVFKRPFDPTLPFP